MTDVEILIAEDSPTQAQRLMGLLEEHDFKVTRVTNGQLALDAARARKPTLVITDVMMPVMDGFQLCRRLKADPKLSDIPVMLVTTLSDPEDVIRGLESGADSFILKPYEDRQLLSRVQFVLLNREVRGAERAGMGVEVFFNGQKHFITAERLQILNLLLSTYEAAIERNRDLDRAQAELRDLASQLEDRVRERTREVEAANAELRNLTETLEERVAERTAQLAAANEELESFSYSVSHDLRAPLRHIHGFAQLLAEQVGPTLDAESAEYLERITRAAQRMDQLITDLLSFARMSRVEMMQDEVDMGSLIRETMRGLPEVEGREVRWKIDPAPTVRADREMIRQVLINLLSNALKYSRTRPVSEIAVTVERTPAEVVFAVHDNGVGFDMSHAGKLFGVFQRLHNSSEFEGTGVGLANVRRIVARHGGRTWAEGKKGEGASFYFSIPVNGS